MNLAAELLDRNLHRGFGNRPALLWTTGSWSFAELAAAVGRAGNALLALGARPGELVLLRLPFGPDAVACLLGAIRVGCVPVPTSILLGPQELAAITADSGARLALSGGDMIRALTGIGVRVVDVAGAEWASAASDVARRQATAGPDDVAYILYTSGSTGRPKGVLRAHRTLAGSAGPNCDALMHLVPEDVCYQPHQDLSFSYVMGHGLMFPLYAGAAAVADPARGPDGRFDPRLCFEAARRHGVTVFSAATAVYRRLAEVPSPEGLRVRLWTAAAEPVSPELLAAWQARFGRPIYETMGQSEVPSFIGNYPGVEIRPGSLGRPFPGIDVRVLREDLSETAPEELGLLAIRADYPGLCSGYHGSPERWAAVCHDGWYFTQDMVRRDAEGYAWYVCRRDELIKVRGYTVAPHEVEAALESHPAVREAGVVGRGGELVAFVALEPGAAATEEGLRAHVRGRLAAYKVPARVVFRPELPKTTSGKLKRRDLLAEPA